MAAVNPPISVPRPPPNRRVGMWITLVILAAVGAALVWRGFDFYRQGLADRSSHPDYRTLSPSGFLGHGYGIIGTAMILTNLLYLVRRRFAASLPSWVGSMKAWLNMHVFTGLVGSLLILFHSAFQLRTPIASVTSASLFIVVMTGLIGLYIHSLVPKAGLKPLNDRLEEIKPLLPGLVRQVEEFVKKTPATTLPYDAGLFRTIFTIPRWTIEARTRRRDLFAAAREDRMVRVLERTDPKLAKAFMVELGDLAAKEVDVNAGAAMMRSWRSLHRFLAILMVVSVSVHIGVAWFYGFRWIFE